MHEHHRQTIENLRNHFQANDENIALIINGSVAREDARAESDVDFYLVVAEPIYEESLAKNAAILEAHEACVAPCPEANGFAISKSALKEIRMQGSEYLRWAFTKARVVYTKDAEIENLVREIPTYPEAEYQYRMESYHSQIYYHFSFFQFAFYSQTKYLIYETATRMLLAAGRLILADNRQLYPGRKWFYRELEKMPDQPSGLSQAMLTFLETPTIDLGQRIIDMIENHKTYPVPPEGMKTRIVRESNLNLEGW